jgi:predicted nucleotidyltransferase
MTAQFFTLAEQKSAAVMRIRQRCEALQAELGKYARERAGRFVLYGSVMRGDQRFDSDVDILVDFPESEEGEAWRHAEQLCRGLGLKGDIALLRTASPRFIEHIQRDMRVIS